MSQIRLLMILFFCHFLADYTSLCNTWMCKAKEFWTPLFPIFCHAWIHAILMWLVLFIWSSGTWISWTIILQLSLFQLITHFLIDILKGKINYHFTSLRDVNSDWYRILFGLDQYLHIIVILMMAYYYNLI